MHVLDIAHVLLFTQHCFSVSSAQVGMAYFYVTYHSLEFIFGGGTYLELHVFLMNFSIFSIRNCQLKKQMYMDIEITFLMLLINIEKFLEMFNLSLTLGQWKQITLS